MMRPRQAKGRNTKVVTSFNAKTRVDSRPGASAPGSFNVRTSREAGPRRSGEIWQTPGPQKAVSGNTRAGSTPVFGTIRRRDVTAAIPALETGGRKTVQVQLLSSVPMSSEWDSVIARSRGRPLTVTNRSYAGLAESADAPGREPGGRIQSAMGVQISRSAPSTQEIVVKAYGARRRDRGCCPGHD